MRRNASRAAVGMEPLPPAARGRPAPCPITRNSRLPAPARADRPRSRRPSPSPLPRRRSRCTPRPSTVQTGGVSSLTWTSENATSCVASGAWSGTKSVSGTQSTGAISTNSTYVLTCTGLGGKASQSTTVTVASTTPTVALSATPSTVSKGGTAALTWKSANATSCTASGAWAGRKATSGSQSTGARRCQFDLHLDLQRSGRQRLAICHGIGQIPDAERHLKRRP